MTCVLLSSPAASVADAGFVAEITDFAVSRKTFVCCFPCKNDCPTSDNDSKKADCSETSFHSSPVEQRLRNALFYGVHCPFNTWCTLWARSIGLIQIRETHSSTTLTR